MLLRPPRAAAVALLALCLGAPRAAVAQATQPIGATPPRDACSYTACALSIAPRWNGLAVVRGTSTTPVANLDFFWPRDVSAALRGDDAGVAGAESAAAEARRAVRLRRIGAALTDGGVVLAGVAAVRALGAGRIRRSDGILLGAGAASLGLSVPFQFAADGALSRAVWWHNLRFAR